MEAKVFKFIFYSVETEAVGKRRIYIKSLACNLILLAWQHAAERAHVVKAVGNLD